MSSGNTRSLAATTPPLEAEFENGDSDRCKSRPQSQIKYASHISRRDADSAVPARHAQSGPAATCAAGHYVDPATSAVVVYDARAGCNPRPS